MAFTQETQISCPRTTVFDLMSDVRNETRWSGDVKRVEMTSDAPVQQGSQFVVHAKPPLGRIGTTIAACDRPERLEFHATSNAMELVISSTFTENGSGTVLQATFDPKPKGVMKVLLPLMMPMIRRNIAKSHGKFKEFCESQAQSPTP